MAIEIGTAFAATLRSDSGGTTGGEALTHFVSRRRAIAVIVGSTAATGAGLLVWRHEILSGWIARPQLRLAELTDDLPGPLEPAVAHLLSAAAEGLVGLSLDRSHYEAFYTWRAGNLPGYRELYEQLAESIRKADGAGPSFETLEPAARQHRLRVIPGAFGRPRWFEGLWNPRSQMVRRHFVDETLRLFDATDAWVLLGYDVWPGVPRGLEAYRKPPPLAGGASLNR